MRALVLPAAVGAGALSGRPLEAQRYAPSVITARVEAALIGSFIADAAAMPLHWEYNVNIIAQKVGNGDPAFYSPPLNLWYVPVPSTLHLQQTRTVLTLTPLAGMMAKKAETLLMGSRTLRT